LHNNSRIPALSGCFPEGKRNAVRFKSRAGAKTPELNGKEEKQPTGHGSAFLCVQNIYLSL
jgi:hypothetical protein